MHYLLSLYYSLLNVVVSCVVNNLKNVDQCNFKRNSLKSVIHTFHSYLLPLPSSCLSSTRLNQDNITFLPSLWLSFLCSLIFSVPKLDRMVFLHLSVSLLFPPLTCPYISPHQNTFISPILANRIIAVQSAGKITGVLLMKGVCAWAISKLLIRRQGCQMKGKNINPRREDGC